MRYGVGDNRRKGLLFLIVAAVMIVLVVCAGRAADVISWHVALGKIQQAADDGAHAASIAAALGENPASVARRAIARDGLVDGKNKVKVEINVPPTRGRYAGSRGAIEIIISKTEPMYFTSLFLRLAPTVTEQKATVRTVAELPWASS